MRFEISYCKGYGWHCGRPLLWLCQMVLGCATALVGVLLDAILRAATHVPIPLALCAPFVFAWLLRRALLLLDVLIWGSVIASQLGIIDVYYVATKWPH